MSTALQEGREAPSRSVSGAPSPAPASIAAQAMATVRAPGPWLIAACFAFYAGQFTGIFSFLTTVYREYGMSPPRA